ncbi:MAG: C40 family peptidase, partial [Gemmatimonadales bacterium]
FGPYVVAGAEIGLITDTAAHSLGLAWTGGVGLEWQPFEWIAFQVESRFRASDPGPRGFWDLAPGAPAGLGIGAGVAIRWGPGGGLGGGSTAPRPAPEPPGNIRGSAADVVRTALEAVGTPYRWGGTEQNGFDCSGLIQYAYAQHGFALPRVSREQMRTGYEIPLDTLALEPGDILGFAAVPGRGVSHVGMWVGEGMFIHSSSSGVRLSRLNPFDPDGKWHWARWVGTRRVIR